uniref:Leishmanolysin-like peptidase n=1 Tax=Panagrolaimus sp. ES5 TaxID=591445 RepID=A0AC34F9I4_9BILA
MKLFLLVLVLSFVNFVTAAKWVPLNVALARPSNLQQLPDFVMRGLDDAINSLNKFINVRVVNVHDEYLLNRDNILQCSKNKDFFTEFITVEKFVPKYSISKHKIDGSEVCTKDPFMLAGAAPCMKPNAKLQPIVSRPVCGRLIVCLENPTWKTFESSYDLFRHEIMHALGFGTIIPDKYNNVTKPETQIWNNNYGHFRPSQKYEAYYMDFAKKSTEAAKKYFLCDKITGIEAEDSSKIHLNEYIYGNELMTPVVSNGNNYLTYLSASILESTYLGKTSWYKFNKKAVKEESRHYWYGRGWGCSFVQGSCYDYIKDSRTLKRGSTFPFCGEEDLRDFLLYRKPKEICFSNGDIEIKFNVSCNLMKTLIQPTAQFEPTPMLSQFPRLRHLLDSVGYPLYGSDSFHRYCPMIKEYLEDQIKDLPETSEIIPCE